MDAYLDTSAYLAILFGEKSGDKIQKIISGKIYSSWLLYCEAKRTILHYRRQNWVDDAQLNSLLDQFNADCEVIGFCALNDAVLKGAAFPSSVLPKSSDIAHLQTALFLRGQSLIEVFISRDIVQINAAKEMGLAVPTVLV
jgi:hypothetical protein